MAQFRLEMKARPRQIEKGRPLVPAIRLADVGVIPSSADRYTDYTEGAT